MTVIDINCKSRSDSEREKERCYLAENILESMIDCKDDGGYRLVSIAMDNYAEPEDWAKLEKWIWEKFCNEPDDADPFLRNMLFKAAKSTVSMTRKPCDDEQVF